MYYTSKYHSLPVVDHSIRKPAVLSDTRNDITETVNIQHDNATMHMELPDNRQPTRMNTRVYNHIEVCGNEGAFLTVQRRRRRNRSMFRTGDDYAL